LGVWVFGYSVEVRDLLGFWVEVGDLFGFWVGCSVGWLATALIPQFYSPVYVLYVYILMIGSETTIGDKDIRKEIFLQLFGGFETNSAILNPLR
jgi:hypothetical protein